MNLRPDGKVYDGEWAYGKQHGMGVYINAKGVRIKAEWNMGKKVRRIDDDDGTEFNNNIDGNNNRHKDDEELVDNNED